jgi:2-amino-4-hydroxy-6-hydroxymethyldihydropteridine diphosphokinase
MIECYIGLGSNLQNPTRQIQTAINELSACRQLELVRASSLYRSTPLGPHDQPDFINAVAHMHTNLSATAVLDQLQAIEQAHQRKRIQRWGPRTLDLDLLLYGDQTIVSARLSVPHREMMLRNFVLYPLFEIAPQLILPQGQPLASLLSGCSMGTLERLKI